MAHLLIEYSANLRHQLDMQPLVDALHAAALATGIFPIGGLRTRAYASECYRIADGDASNAFVHVSVRVGHGRDLETRRRACEQIFEAACAQLDTAFARVPLGLSVEMQEIDPQLSFKKNNLHDYVKSRRAASSSSAGSAAA
ncbi:MAG TPA: 5-carboxymethyl-2-hydroxymuconate Delta-isomerase [Steroidobacteraceae bacterium]|nr:5-carboxymethyl-2-hydroxymuconate Delta-isomerase [Steroidobacteraceae bacterium]